MSWFLSTKQEQNTFLPHGHTVSCPFTDQLCKDPGGTVWILSWLWDSGAALYPCRAPWRASIYYLYLLPLSGLWRLEPITADIKVEAGINQAKVRATWRDNHSPSHFYLKTIWSHQTTSWAWFWSVGGCCGAYGELMHAQGEGANPWLTWGLNQLPSCCEAPAAPQCFPDFCQ